MLGGAACRLLSHRDQTGPAVEEEGRHSRPAEVVGLRTVEAVLVGRPTQVSLSLSTQFFRCLARDENSKN